MSKAPGLLSFLPAPKTSSNKNDTTAEVTFLKTKPVTTTETTSNNKSTNEKQTSETSDLNNKKTAITMLLPRSVTSAKPPITTSSTTTTKTPSSVKTTTTTTSTVSNTKHSEPKVVRSIVSYGYDDDDDDDDEDDNDDKYENKNEEEESIDFFNVNKKTEEIDELPNTSHATTSSSNIPFKKSKIGNYEADNHNYERNHNAEENNDEEEYDDDDDDDEEEEEGEDYEQVNQVDPPIEEILRSMGGKRRHEQIDFVDVNVNQIVKDNKEQLLKNLSQQPIRPARKYTGGGRKKHQITYLAMLAKEQEEALQASWADNKFKRRQAREKYGF